MRLKQQKKPKGRERRKNPATRQNGVCHVAGEGASEGQFNQCIGGENTEASGKAEKIDHPRGGGQAIIGGGTNSRDSK